MAKILKEQRSLNWAFRRRAGSGLVLVGIGVMLLVLSCSIVPQTGRIRVIDLVLPISGVMSILSGVGLINKGYKFRIGAVGERKVTKLLSNMPDDWYIFNDITVWRSQIDHIVICPKGVYTIETKNYQGTIYGNAKKREWVQVISYKRKARFYNPVKQALRHSVTLSKYLKGRGFNVWVDTIVVFANPDVELKVYSPDVPVLRLSELEEFFENRKQVMKPEECYNVSEHVRELVYVKI